MASQNTDSAVNIGSLVGTWLGTFFTGFGLLAVLTQLQSLLHLVRNERRRWKEGAAGEWASCILMDHLPNNGVTEGVLPVFSGWLQEFYLEGKSIAVSQDDRGTSGKSSWSNLFSRLDIKAIDLNEAGGPARRQRPAQLHGKAHLKTLVRPLRPGLADTLVENRSISYGFSAAEFAALIILCGFRPEDFTIGKSCSSVSWFGKILVGELGQFSQVARFDPHHGFRDQIQSFHTDMLTIPVAQCLNLALGIIRTRGRRGREWVIVPELPEHECTREIWSKYPHSPQLRRIKYSFCRFVGVTEVFSSDYSHHVEVHDAEDLGVFHNLLSTSQEFSVAQDSPASRNKARGILNVAYAIAAIVPWAIHPIMPQHLALALAKILEPFFKTREITVQVIQSMLGEIPYKAVRPGGWTGKNIIALLDNVVADKHRFFVDSGGSYAFIYYEGMSLVFQHHNIHMEEVRIKLAAAVSVDFLKGDNSLSIKSNHVQQRMTEYLETCYLNPMPAFTPRNVPDWALDIYANYLFGWVSAYIPADLGLIDHFRRRVFLA